MPLAAANPLSALRTITDEGRTYLVDEPRALVPSGAPPGLPQGSPAASYSLAQYQTPVRDQGDRGTCWAFAGAAALEAAYKRKYNDATVLSTQYVFFLGKVQELAYSTVDPARSHENNSTLWGFQGNSDIVEKMARSAVPPEAAAPYLSQSAMTGVQATIPGAGTITQSGATPSQAVMDAFEFDPRIMPPAAFFQCQHQVATWQAGNNWSSDVLEGIIASNHEVVTFINLQYKVDANGVWQYDSTVNNGGHVIVLIGYDRAKQQFQAKNSWGGTSFLWVSYDFIQHCAADQHYITDVVNPAQGKNKRAFWMGHWTLDYDGWRGDLVIRRHTDYRNASDGPTRLGSFTRDGVTYDVNGSFSDGDQKCTFFIAPNGDRVTPGSLTGQRFDLYCFSWDNTLCAGTTVNGGTTYGALMSRQPLPAEVPNTFSPQNWVGRYALNWDGWKGTLAITGISPVSGTLTPSGGQPQPVSGQVNGHELELQVHSGNSVSSYDLFYHTWEKGVISGTVGTGPTYGVVGFAV